MGRPRGVVKDVIQLPLTDGDWIEVKKYLSAKESRLITFDSIKGYSNSGERMELDGNKLAFIAAAIYIVRWSLVDLDGAPRAWFGNMSIDQRIAALQDLDELTFNEIDEALTAHRRAVQAEREKNEKSTATGDTKSSTSAMSLVGG